MKEAEGAELWKTSWQQRMSREGKKVNSVRMTLNRWRDPHRLRGNLRPRIREEKCRVLPQSNQINALPFGFTATAA